MKKTILLFFICVSIFFFTNCDFYSQPEKPQEKPQNQQLGRTPDPVQVVKSYEKQSCDWLIIMYVDGDNDLHDALYTDLNEIEDALRKYSEKTGEKPSVKVVALWDGYKITGSNFGSTATQILELGPDFNINVKKLCSNTKDLTATAYSQNNNWLNYNPSTEIAEANMGDKNTLSNFLKWVDKYYDATLKYITPTGSHIIEVHELVYDETLDSMLLGKDIKEYYPELELDDNKMYCVTYSEDCPFYN